MAGLTAVPTLRSYALLVLGAATGYPFPAVPAPEPTPTPAALDTDGEIDRTDDPDQQCAANKGNIINARRELRIELAKSRYLAVLQLFADDLGDMTNALAQQHLAQPPADATAEVEKAVRQHQEDMRNLKAYSTIHVEMRLRWDEEDERERSAGA